MNRTLTAIALVLVLPATAAFADDDCHVPMDQWQPREAVQKLAQSRGWTVGRIKIDDGCYQIRGTDANGQGFKAKVDPATLEVVKMRRRDDDGDRDRRRDRGDDDRGDDRDDDGRRHEQRHEQRRPADAGAANPAPLPGTPPGNGLFTGSQPPAVTVK